MSASPNNTILTTPGGIITDASGNTWQLSADGRIVVNGVPDPTTANVIVLAYENGRIWQENASRLWWSKASPSDPWGPPFGTTASPLVGVASPNDTILVGSVVSSLFPHQITDANDDRWTITASGQVAVNGVADPTTANVIALAYENGRVWQENADKLWWSKARASDSWSPGNGTAHSPIPAGMVAPMVLYLQGSVVNYTDTAAPGVYRVETIDDGGQAITFNYQGTNTSAGNIRNGEGDLVLQVQGRLTNSGAITTQGGIGNAITTIGIAAGATFDNTGTIEALYAGSTPVGGTMHVTGAGTFRNDGTMTIDGGSSTDFDMTGRIVNAGRLAIDDSFGTTHAIMTTGGIVNTGLIENHNVTTIQWGYSGPPVAGAVNQTFTNNGTIEGLNDVSQLKLAVGNFAHNADGSLVHEYHGTLVNNGEILAFGGGDLIEIAAPLRQGSSGHVDVQNGATVKLDSTSDGGTIRITSGMLEFGGDRVAFHGPAGAAGFHSNVVLDGDSAAFNFERSDFTEMFKATSVNTADLIITIAGNGAPEQLAAIHLVGAYHASQFQQSGNEVIFTKSG